MIRSSVGLRYLYNCAVSGVGRGGFQTRPYRMRPLPYSTLPQAVKERNIAFATGGGRGEAFTLRHAPNHLPVYR